MTSSVIARSNGVMYHWWSAYETDFSFFIFLSSPVYPHHRITLIGFGIFGRATTEAATTAKARRWWDWRGRLYWRVSKMKRRLVQISASTMSWVPSTFSSSSTSITIVLISPYHWFSWASTATSISPSGATIACLALLGRCRCCLQGCSSLCCRSHFARGVLSTRTSRLFILDLSPLNLWMKMLLYLFYLDIEVKDGEWDWWNQRWEIAVHFTFKTNNQWMTVLWLDMEQYGAEISHPAWLEMSESATSSRRTFSVRVFSNKLISIHY